MPDADGLRVTFTRLEAWGVARGWSGADPYEGLNSPLARIALTPLSRRLVIQAYKRMPLEPVWPLRAPVRANAKTVALVLSGYSQPAADRFAERSGYLARALSQLRDLNLDRGGRAAWGYPFDVQTRSIGYRAGTPNAIATCFVVGALLDAHAATGSDAYAELALRARPYLAEDLYARGPHGPCFGYVAAGSELIHNANALVCGALARLHALAPDPATAVRVRQAAATTAALQRPDGWWPYGEAESLRWIDGFHTAYVLEGLLDVRDGLGSGVPDGVLETGCSYFREHLIAPDGTARLAPGRRYPIDAHCQASAIDLLWRLDSEDSLDEASGVAHTAVRELWDPVRGCFGVQRTGLRANRRVFVRWTNAPMFRALSRLLSAVPADQRGPKTTRDGRAPSPAHGLTSASPAT
jgi:hypothetical protein